MAEPDVSGLQEIRNHPAWSYGPAGGNFP